MKRETITISVRPDLKRYILRRAAADFDSVSAYIRKLVMADNYLQRELAKDRNRPVVNEPRPTRGPWENAYAWRP